MELIDTYRHKGLRKKMVDDLRKKGIKDEKVLSALEKVPRHFFLDNAFLESSYEDHAFQIGEGQTITQPYTVAYQSSLLNLQKGDKVLEIGTGSGYQASILAEMGARVFTIERFRSLREKADQLLKNMGYHQIKTFFGDGFDGLPTFAPFNKIIITASGPEIPETLIKQLSINGLAIMPIGSSDIQKMACLTKISDTENEISYYKSFKFVPFLPGKVW